MCWKIWPGQLVKRQEDALLAEQPERPLLDVAAGLKLECHSARKMLVRHRVENHTFHKSQPFSPPDKLFPSKMRLDVVVHGARRVRLEQARDEVYCASGARRVRARIGGIA